MTHPLLREGPHGLGFFGVDCHRSGEELTTALVDRVSALANALHAEAERARSSDAAWQELIVVTKGKDKTIARLEEDLGAIEGLYSVMVSRVVELAREGQELRATAAGHERDRSEALERHDNAIRVLNWRCDRAQLIIDDLRAQRASDQDKNRVEEECPDQAALHDEIEMLNALLDKRDSRIARLEKAAHCAGDEMPWVTCARHRNFLNSLSQGGPCAAQDQSPAKPPYVPNPSAMEEIARDAQDEAEWMKGLLDECAVALGVGAYTNEDEVVCDEPVYRKVPEIVRQLVTFHKGVVGGVSHE